MIEVDLQQVPAPPLDGEHPASRLLEAVSDAALPWGEANGVDLYIGAELTGPPPWLGGEGRS